MVKLSWGDDEIYQILTAFLDPIVSNGLRIFNVLQTDIKWTMGYLFFFIIAYLFHSPFRNSVAERDTYARVMKTLQIWSTLIAFYFHFGPKLLAEKRHLVSSMEDNDILATIFFPIFFFATLLFLFLHKMKRRFRMGVTYGSSLTFVLLNSMVVAIVSTGHYMYGYHFFTKQEESKRILLKTIKKIFYVSSVSETPFHAIGIQMVFALIFVGVDYLYKKIRGFDPNRGLLWSDLYDLVKISSYDKKERKSGTDWRLLEPKPKVIRKDNLKSKISEEMLWTNASFNNSTMSDVFNSTLTEFNFAIEEEKKTILEAKHPKNRPGMVPWWSTFVFSTAWESFAANTLGFLSFDVRLLQTAALPKIFRFHFVSKLGPRGIPKSESNASSVSSPTSLMENYTPAEDEPIDVWFDWIADVGDGFNSTYDLARLLAQPELSFESKCMTNRSVESMLQDPLTPMKSSHQKTPEFSEFDQPPLRQRGLSVSQDAFAPSKVFAPTSGTMKLPRGSFVILGGDLAYPDPTDETYSTRLFEPYSDALRGNVHLKRFFYENQHKIFVKDKQDNDIAHATLLDAMSISKITKGGDSLRSLKGTPEEALRTVPLLFAIPGNHDWFDGLTTFSKYIIEKSWMGGWLMPQKSSYFVIVLPFNWFIFCCDTGNQRDIDVRQKNYFLDVISKQMDNESCAVLTCHEPGWLVNAFESENHSVQPQIDALVRALGTRLRLRVSGDIHNYSRHVPKDPLSEAAMLVVSGGGGAFLHGSRDAKTIEQGTEYVRTSAFPRKNTYTSIAARLWGFRVVNWKFDMIIGTLCFGIILSFVPLSTGMMDRMRSADTLSEFYSRWFVESMRLFYFLFAEAKISLLPFGFYFMCFSLAGADRGASILWRVAYSSIWSSGVLFLCCGMLTLLYGMFIFLQKEGMILSSRGKWDSMLERQTRASLVELIDHSVQILGETHFLGKALRACGDYFFNSFLDSVYTFVLKCLDPIETIVYLSFTVASDELGVFAPQSTRLQIIAFHLHLLFYFWILVTPVVSILIGIFLFVSVRCFGYMYDGVYSAFQIEDYKHFLRFRLDHKTRELHCFVIAREKVPKVWELSPQHTAELFSPSQTLAPHLQENPSRWRPVYPSTRLKKSQKKVHIHDHFIVKPHRSPAAAKTL